MEHSLTVYRASAGSGKTFTLASEYIKLLITNPLNYRMILAVTFTNKATEEMKMRILGQLYGVWKRMPDSQSYMDKITSELEITPEYTSEHAGIALGYLLHNYNYFNVETIDAFFQSVLRNLARELDLNTNLRVMLNDRQVEQQAVDEMIDDLKPDSKVLGWIMDYIKDNIDNDKGWNVIGSIKKFGENIFKDQYKDNSKKLNDILSQSGFFTNYVSELKAIKAKSQQNITQFAKDFFDELDKNGLSIDDFSYGKGGVCGYFIKLKNCVFDENELLKSRVIEAMKDPMKWVKKGNGETNANILDLVNTKLLKLLKYSEEMRPAQAKLYKSADITLRHLNQLRLLNKIETKIRERNNETNQFLLSDTQTLLHNLIVESDSPFIFEKIGTQLKHVMIDEFQDTSAIQWRNFKILLQECMSYIYSRNMLVGDVKQSIYRWRSGDWRLLNNISDEFKSSINTIEIKNLGMNYRSNGNIIRFNNAFFKTAPEIEYDNLKEDNPIDAEQLRQAYSDVEQIIPMNGEQGGLVHIELLPRKDYNEETMKRLVGIVDKLIAEGVSVSDIAILVRSNDSIAAIANYFMRERPNIKLVSNEAFRLDASQAVNLIVDALRHLTHPEDKITIANLAKSYQKQILHNCDRDNELLVKGLNINDLLPYEYVTNMYKLLYMPLLDLVEEICHIFEINKLTNQSAYVCAFYDQLNDFLSNNITDIDSFINEWNENIHKKSIQSDEIDGIRLLTIHRSKGLEFDNVLLPFCDWQLEKSNSIWCTPTESPFNALPIVPIDFSKKLKGTIYEKDYLNEHLQNTVDNLNLLYVAFTRAGKNLFIFGERQAANYRSFLIERSLDSVVETLKDSVVEGLGADKAKPITFSYGELAIGRQRNKAKMTQNVFNETTTPYNLAVESFESKVEFRQSNKSKDFINDDIGGDKQSGYIKMGNILHNLFSTIHTTADIDNALKSLENEGVLYDNAVKKEELETMLRKHLENPKVASWFSGKWTLFNECAIISVDPNTDKLVERRPDRVMTDGKEMIVVDFKFGHPREEYHDQVHNYMQLLRLMGYKDVTGYLWFVYTNNIEEVK